MLFIERIFRDDTFLVIELEKVELFFKNCILPELLAKCFTQDVSKPLAVSSSDVIESACYCRNPRSGTMLKCDSEQCPVKHYHMKCLKLKSVPKKWLCPNCKQIQNRLKRQQKN